MYYIYILYICIYTIYILYILYIYTHYIYIYILCIYNTNIYIYIIPISITSEDSHDWLRPTLHPGGLHVGPAIPPSGLRDAPGRDF